MTDLPTSNPMTLMSIAAGFRRARLLAVAVEVGTFDALAQTPSGVPASTFADTTGLPARTAQLLLDGCVGLGLVARTEQDSGEPLFCNSTVAADFLVRGQPYYFGDFLLFNDFRGYQGWTTLADAVRSDAPTSWPNQRPLDSHPDPEVARARFRGALDPGTRWTASIIARSFDFGGFGSVLDLGGGIGAYCLEFAEHYPELHFTLFDRPPTIELAAENIADRTGVTLVAGDFWTDPIPTGHDAILLSNVLADWSDRDVVDLAGRCRAAVEPGGAVIVAETFFDDSSRSTPETAVMHGIHMILETHAGRNRTRDEYRTLLSEVGFRHIDELDLLETAPGANGLLIARG
ncbi:methyltransferase [Rhodococcoides kyotonense]|uniref:Dimerisation domain-containing protein n=1 Tax=Rhodococcoides kyotonense TaxID=398843 RepID=A0A239MCZ5_9NOCA|nr:methyltransferase [Rhodococcus kyotonensis]SNT40013.1 Dimerisation domain-containing protein [Rhodococcus kyotonensis]